VQIPNLTNAPAGGTITIPVLLNANGNENALSFSLNFSTSRLTYVSTASGSGAGAATILINDSEVASGRLGIALALPTDMTFPPGTQEIINVMFNVAVVTNNATTTISFTDQPIVRQLADSFGNILPAVYLGGTLSISSVDFEADVSPRPNGNKAVTVTDWVLIGRFAAGLDSPTNASEFQRADCAPRSSLGNGHITVTDWVQAGRYVARLDPLTPAGGPTSPQVQNMPRIVGATTASSDLDSRQVRISDTMLTAGQIGTVSVNLQAKGDENAIGFSLTFDPNLIFQGASLGSASTGATLNVNASQISSGRLGFVLALSSGKNFSAGANELIKVSFRAAPAAMGSHVLGYTDDPVLRETSDPAAGELPTDYVTGTIIIDPLPSLKIALDDQWVTLSWPLSATNYVLQEAESASVSDADWKGVTETPNIINTDKVINLPIDHSAKFYRLQRQ
jgi:hypothetical protein